MDVKAKASAKSGGEESGTDTEAAAPPAGKAAAAGLLDPTAKSFQPSPLAAAGSALDAASPLPTTSGGAQDDVGNTEVVSEAAPLMDVDEDGEVVMELLDGEKRKAAAAAKRASGPRERGGEREEGEEEEEDGDRAVEE